MTSVTIMIGVTMMMGVMTKGWLLAGPGNIL
jgi:hypothetical protein